MNAVELTTRLKTHQTRRKGDTDRAELLEMRCGASSQVLQKINPRLSGIGTYLVGTSAWGGCLHVVSELTSRSCLDRPLIRGEAGWLPILLVMECIWHSIISSPGADRTHGKGTF